MNFWVDPLNVLFRLEGTPPLSWLFERATRLSPLLDRLIVGEVRLMLPGFAKAGKPPEFYLTSKFTSGELLSVFMLLKMGVGLFFLKSSRAAYARVHAPVTEFFFSLKILVEVSKLFGDRLFNMSF